MNYLIRQYETGYGQVHLAQFKRENIKDVIKFLQENCDVTYAEHPKEIHACGLGGNEFSKLLESAFNLKKVFKLHTCIMFQRPFNKKMTFSIIVTDNYCGGQLGKRLPRLNCVSGLGLGR